MGTLDALQAHNVHTQRVYTHVYDVREVMDVIFEDTAVGGLKRQQVLVPGFDGLQFVLCVLGLSLIDAVKAEREKSSFKTNWKERKK